MRFKPEDCGEPDLNCDATLVFHAFAQGGQNHRTSEPVSCSTKCPRFLRHSGESCQEECAVPNPGCIEPCGLMSTGRNEAGSCIGPDNLSYKNLRSSPTPTGLRCVRPTGSQADPDCSAIYVQIPNVQLVTCFMVRDLQPNLYYLCVRATISPTGTGSAAPTSEPSRNLDFLSGDARRHY